MAGYSGTPLPRKLGIKEGHRVAVTGAPEGFDRTLGELPEGVRVASRVRGSLDVVVCFLTRRAELKPRFEMPPRHISRRGPVHPLAARGSRLT